MKRQGPIPQPFNALNGLEAIDVILHQIKTKLLETGEFRPHITLPWIQLDWKVSLTVHPQQQKSDPPGIVVEDTAYVGNVDLSNPDVVTYDLANREVIDTPDKTRQENGLIPKVPTPVKGDTSIFGYQAEKPTVHADVPLPPPPSSPTKRPFKGATK